MDRDLYDGILTEMHSEVWVCTLLFLLSASPQIPCILYCCAANLTITIFAASNTCTMQESHTSVLQSTKKCSSRRTNHKGAAKEWDTADQGNTLVTCPALTMFSLCHRIRAFKSFTFPQFSYRASVLSFDQLSFLWLIFQNFLKKQDRGGRVGEEGQH